MVTKCTGKYVEIIFKKIVRNEVIHVQLEVKHSTAYTVGRYFYLCFSCFF